MDDRFLRFIDVIFAHEGGYVNDPDDSGGETRYGITKRRYPELDIKHLTKEKARDIYYADFYVALNLHYIKDDLLALHLFDMAVNAGRSNAVKMLQELLKGVMVDGRIGPITGKAVSDASKLVNMVDAYIAKRVEYYYKVSLRGNNQKFLKGWINRIYNTTL
jgi:lysozyme family protein